MIIAKKRKDTSKITEYKKCLRRLCESLDDKIERVECVDTREDLMILRTKVETIMEFVKTSGL